MFEGHEYRWIAREKIGIILIDFQKITSLIIIDHFRRGRRMLFIQSAHVFLYSRFGLSQASFASQSSLVFVYLSIHAWSYQP
jgi:hypothetical protein